MILIVLLIVIIITILVLIINKYILNQKDKTYWYNNRKPPKNSDWYIIYSMSNSAYQQWQADFLDFSVKHFKIKATIIRLLSLDYQYPDYPLAISTSGYTLICPDHTKIKDTNIYTMNKPYSLIQLFKHHNFNPLSRVLNLDPDMVFNKSIDLNKYSTSSNTIIGQRWYGSGVNQKEINNYFMYPFICSMKVLKKISKLYYIETKKKMMSNKAWMDDMYGLVYSCIKNNVEIKIHNSLGLANDWDRPHYKKEYNINIKNAPILHYCQSIIDKNDKELWSKHNWKKGDYIPSENLTKYQIDKNILILLNKWKNNYHKN